MKPELESLLLDWEERRDRGEVVSLDMLCTLDAADEAELRRQAQLLDAYDRLLGESSPLEEPLPERLSVPKTLGPYEVRGILGRGGMGVVYGGWDPILQRRVALKVLRPLTPWLAQDDRDRLSRRFSQEGQVLAQLNHAHIVPVYAATVESSGCCIVMEQVRGGSLDQHREDLAQSGPYAVAAFMEKVARAVHHAHSHGILHRDLKPANILLDEAGEPRVSDFGLAKLFAEPGTDGVMDSPLAGANCTGSVPPGELTLPGQEPGTPPYMAPEQFDPKFGPIRPTTDVWSLGVIFYELLTGSRPFQGKTRLELATSIRCENPTPPRKHQPRLPRRLERIALRCLAKDPQQRYPTAEALADALQHFQQSPRRLARLLVIGLSALVFLGAIVAPLLRSKVDTPLPNADSPSERAYAEYRAQAAPLVERLGRGESVELVAQSDGNPKKTAFFPRDNGVAAMENGEGVRVRGNGFAHYLEFLPSIPLSHYRITAKVRIDAAFGADCQWGVYCRYDQEQSSHGLQRYYQAVTVAREDALTLQLPLGRKYWTYDANLMFHLYADPDRLSPGQEIHRNEHWVQPNVKPYVSWQERTELAGQLWQTVVLEVSPESVQASCLNTQGRVSLPPLGVRVNAQFLKILRDRYEDLAAIPWFPRPGSSAVGIFLRASMCMVSGFQVEPMSAVNPSPK